MECQLSIDRVSVEYRSRVSIDSTTDAFSTHNLENMQEFCQGLGTEQIDWL